MTDRLLRLRERSQGCAYGVSGCSGTSFCYVRHAYGVPAKRGMRVMAGGKPGTITSGDGNYIRIRLDGDTRSGRYHPTSDVIYEPRCEVEGCGYGGERFGPWDGKLRIA